MLEYEKFQELQGKSQRMQEDYEHQLSEMEEKREQALEELTEYYETKLTDLTTKLDQARPLNIYTYIHCCSCLLFLAGLWFTGPIINGHNFHPKFTLAAPL